MLNPVMLTARIRLVHLWIGRGSAGPELVVGKRWGDAGR
jgi:hypothetical protein